MKRERTLIVLCYITLYIVWGSTYLAIKLAVETIPPFYVVGLRYLVGGALLLGLSASRVRGRGRPTLRHALASALLGSLLLIGGNGLITIAEQTVDSYVAALIIANTPLVVAGFDWLLFRQRISAVRLAGIAIGVSGVGLLLYNGDAAVGGLSPGVGMIMGGVGCWGLATSLGPHVRTYPDPLANSGMQMLFVGVVCTVGAALLAPSASQILPALSARSALALLYLSVVGSLAFGAYTYLIAHEPASRVVSYALVNPVIATLLGLLLDGETPVPLLAAGLPLVLVGVGMMLYGEGALARVRAGIHSARSAPRVGED
ncbi:MAG: EamA family transporter [Anaerolineae bacterium]|nr:EamA family transporter [Anaerolineae bacterium]